MKEELSDPLETARFFRCSVLISNESSKMFRVRGQQDHARFQYHVFVESRIFYHILASKSKLGSAAGIDRFRFQIEHRDKKPRQETA